MIWAPFTRRKSTNDLFAIAIWNSNAIVDDNFDVQLNGTSIGTIDNAFPRGFDYTGRIFVEPSGVSSFTPDKFGPQHPNIFETTLSLNMGLLINGTNHLRIYSTQNNGSGNGGSVRVGYWSLTSGFYSCPAAALAAVYASGSMAPGGLIFDDTFTYPNP